MGLINDQRVPFPNIEFDKENVRYRHRFAPFAFIQTPAIVPYVQYKQLADMTSVQPSVNLYVAAARSFHQAKQFLEAIPGTEKEVSVPQRNELFKSEKHFNSLVSFVLISRSGIF